MHKKHTCVYSNTLWPCARILLCHKPIDSNWFEHAMTVTCWPLTTGVTVWQYISGNGFPDAVIDQNHLPWWLSSPIPKTHSYTWQDSSLHPLIKHTAYHATTARFCKCFPAFQTPNHSSHHHSKIASGTVTGIWSPERRVEGGDKGFQLDAFAWFFQVTSSHLNLTGFNS